MATAAKPDTLAAAMARAFAEIEGATKSATNPHFKSKYADLGAVIDAIKPALIANDLFFTQASHVAEDGVCVETVIHHQGGETLSCGKLYVPANKRDAQGFGSALTYCRRYALMTAFGVPAEDDDGNAASKSAPANDYRNGNGNGAKDAPFPQGPAKNKTDLKTQGRELWRQVEGCGDSGELDALLASHTALIKQLQEALPDWWSGGSKDGEPYDGLGTVIARKQTELAADAANGDWRENPLIGG